jgi:hypothetical protein
LGDHWYAARVKSGEHVKPSEMPLLSRNDFDEPSVFTPENLLREAKRQKQLPSLDVPNVCILDPDGDLVRQLTRSGKTEKAEAIFPNLQPFNLMS